MLFLTRLFGGTGDLERQFEFVLKGWINAAKFQGLEHDKDPIAGDRDGTCNMTIQHKPIKKALHGLPWLTTVKGGAYVLLPGLRALRSLGNALSARITRIRLCRAGSLYMKLRVPARRDTLGKDAVAGLVLGVESVPDGLAAGLLAGVNPLAGLYAYLFGTIGGSFFTSSAFMAVQATGAMAIVGADVPAVHSASDPARALFTLSVLTGVVMLAAGFLRLGSVLRFVSNAVMVGFISAVGVNIILGQLANLTGYKAEGANRVVRAINTLVHPGELHLQSLAIGVVTVALILVLERTRLGPLGLVLAVIVASAGAAVLGWHGVATVGELSKIPRALPLPEVPMLRLVPSLVIPAVSLAFVGLIQGAAGPRAGPRPGATGALRSDGSGRTCFPVSMGPPRQATRVAALIPGPAPPGLPVLGDAWAPPVAEGGDKRHAHGREGIAIRSRVSQVNKDPWYRGPCAAAAPEGSGHDGDGW